MSSKFLMSVLGLLIICSSFSQFSLAISLGEINEATVSIEYRNVTVYAPAVAHTDGGYIGVTSTITVTIQNNGSGRVFVDTLPLTQIDMQGSARLAVKVASALVKNDDRCEINPSEYDFFFVIRTSAPIIGGPSAGAIMTTAVTSLLQNWTMDNKTMMTGMINPDGSIGPVGGILQKVDAAYSVGATRFLIPKGQGEYTETITETVSENGWTQITTRQVLRNVSDYALENYGIEVIETEDINDALLYFTGWNFPLIESNASITTEDYIDSMKPLATSLLNDSRESYENASESFDNTEIPNRYPYYYKNQVTDFLNTAEEALIESEDWFDQELYYTSTSKSFQSLINSHFVIYSCEYFNAEDKEDYISSLLNEAKELNINKSNLVKNVEINGMISLQCVGAAQKRASDAELHLSDAHSSYQNGDFLTTLYDIAYANQRSNSAEWWIGISSYFNDSGEIDEGELENLSEGYIEDAQQAVVYSDVILEEMGKSSNYLTDAENILETARDDKEKGYPAAALFEALEALAKANLALELADGITEDKIDRYQESASSSISKSRIRGIEPILAVSYYEYAQSLVNESSTDAAMFYYKYSGLIPGALSFTGTYGGQSSRYTGIPEINISPWNQVIFKYKEYLILFAVIGGLGGLCAGVAIGLLPSAYKGRKEKSNKNLVPRNINNHYDKKINDEYFSEGQIPRSIKDYYKKTK